MRAGCAGQVARKVRKFAWQPSEALVVRCLLKALKGHYAHTAVIANCAASLSRYHPSLSVHLTDVLLERVCPRHLHLSFCPAVWRAPLCALPAVQPQTPSLVLELGFAVLELIQMCHLAHPQTPPSMSGFCAAAAMPFRCRALQHRST